MIETIPPQLVVGVLIGSALITSGMAAYTFRNRANPGAGWLTVTLVATTVWTGSYAAGLLTHTPAWRPFWEHFQWFGTAVLPVSFLLFALAYTGYDTLATRRRVAGLFLVPAITIVLVWTNDWHQLMWIENRVAVGDGLTTMVATVGPWFWVVLGYSYLLVLVGGVLLIRLLFVSEYLYTEQSILFSLGIVLPLLGNVIAVFVDTSPPGFDLTPYGFAIWGITLFVMVYRGELFSLLPATRKLGQNAAIAQLEQGIVIVDATHRIIYVNNATAAMLDVDTKAIVGEGLADILGDESIAPTRSDSVTELHRESRRYELRSSPITDRRDRTIGYTVTVYDVTARHRREQQLERQQRKLERLEELNAAIRGVNQALLSATDRNAVDDAVCDALYERTRYEAVCLADSQTALGLGDEWTIRGTTEPPLTIPELDADRIHQQTSITPIESSERGQSWATVPIVYRNVLYGVLCISAGDEPLSDRERTILTELSELVGHAIAALEHRQLIAAESIVEFTIESTDERSPLVAATTQTDAQLTLEGLVPKSDRESVAFLSVDNASTDAVYEAVAELVAEPVWIVHDDEPVGGGMVAVTVTPSSVLGTLAAATTKLSRVQIHEGTAVYELEAASEQVVRRVVEQVQRSFPRTQLRSKTHRDGPLHATPPEDATIDADLTDRQQEVLEAAFRMGYFAWPRESTAEDVADAMDLAPATIHGHLRKGEQSVFTTIFEESA